MPQLNGLTELNTAKLIRPAVPDDFVPRRRLQDQLDLIERRPLAVISAPAGYGKTITVSAWLESRDAHRAWLALDEHDDNLPVFLSYFVAAVHKAVPTLDLALIPLFEGAGSSTTLSFLTHLDAELDRLDRDLILVLDEFQFIRDADILSLVTLLMRHPHPAFHLVLITRHDPALPLVSWRARNQLVDIRANDLRFELAETAEFLHRASNVQLDKADVAFLQTNTEGWAVALRLATLSLVHGDDLQRSVYDFKASGQDIMDYLADQVLAGLLPATRSFLLQTSILDRMSGPLCDAVLLENEGTSAQAMLEELYRENLFLVSMDHDRQWFRYHNLFQEFLQSRLVRQNPPEDIRRLHSRASRWFADNGHIVEAITHALLAEETDMAVALVAENRHKLSLEDRWQHLETWIRLFPEEMIATTPDLLLIKAWTNHFRQFDTHAVSQVSDQVVDILNHSDFEPAHAEQLAAEAGILRSLVYYFDLDPASAIESCRRSLQVLPKTHYIARSYAWLYMAVGLQMQGDLPGAMEALREARREDLAFPNYPMARASGTAGFLSWIAGDLVGMRNAGELMRTTASIRRQPQSHIWGHYFLAAAHYHLNELEEAMAHAQFAFDQRFSFHSQGAINCGLILALSHTALGHQDKADETLAMAAAYAVAVRSEPLMALTQAMRAELSIRQGRGKEAAHWAELAYSHLQPRAMPLFYSSQLTVPKALLASNDPSKRELIRNCLDRLRTQVENTHNSRFLIEVLALEAMYHDVQGDERAAIAALEHSLSLAEASGFVRIYTDLGHRMRDLLARLPQHIVSAEYLDQIRASFHVTVVSAGNEAMVESLTGRECEVLELLAKRLSNKEIALELFIAEATVKRHTVNIYQKLGVQGRRDAVLAAHNLGILG